MTNHYPNEQDAERNRERSEREATMASGKPYKAKAIMGAVREEQTQGPDSDFWMREVFSRTTETLNLRKKIIIIGEHGGEIRLSRSESKLLAGMLRDHRDPENILD